MNLAAEQSTTAVVSLAVVLKESGITYACELVRSTLLRSP